jgi:hypothetical protein
MRTGVRAIGNYAERCGGMGAPVGGFAPVQHQAGVLPTPQYHQRCESARMSTLVPAVSPPIRGALESKRRRSG